MKKYKMEVELDDNYDVINEAELRDYINSVPIENWIINKYYRIIAYCCDVQIIRKMLEHYPMYKSNIIYTLAIHSVENRNGSYLEYLIALGLDTNRMIDLGNGYSLPLILEDNIEYFSDSGDSGETGTCSLIELAIAHIAPHVAYLLLRNAVDTTPVENNPNFTNTMIRIKAAVCTNRRAARTLIGIKKFRGIYKDIDRFIFREIAISIWSSRDTI